ncbi:MAG: tRNA1(Val) (adenine(37)-N6)-methyltransferase [Pikeienuella sp.]|uniref:tRNA1(Val) (adenine(37)-N6)-methyltransferase n=1 Tax=Pikeienuella sp. TaxID=2831957 RepID=UPI00391B6326
MTGFAPEALTEDALLGGRVRLLQPRGGYRAATDPVLLAAALQARPGERALDLGCGAGAAMLCLAARVPGLELHGLEVQPDYADLARRNAALNGAEATIWEGDAFAAPAELRRIGFDLVLSNPPFFDAAAPAAPDKGRDAARRAQRDAAEWAAAALARLRSGGRLALVHRAESLPALLAGLGAGAGDVSVIPLAARAGRAAKRVIVTARKGAKGPFRLAAPLILHEGPEHLKDGDDFSREAAAILRDGAALAP